MIEYLINRLINLDPYLSEYLRPLEHKTISIACNEFSDKILYCVFDLNHIQLATSYAGEVNLAITGPLSGLLTLAIQKQKADMRSCKIIFSGDALMAQNLQNFLFKLEIDWEDLLAKYSGDVIAHQAVIICKQINNYKQYVGTSLEGMVTEYLQEESNLLPTAFEVNNFICSVDELRLATDRLQAHINARICSHASD